MNLVEKYWSGVLRRLQAEVDGFNSIIGHKGEMGRENELSLSRVLASLMPLRYGVGSGLIFDSKGNRSAQTDIILYDAVNEPAILAQTNQVLFPVENVRGAIEIKTSINGAEIQDIGRKVKSVRELNSEQGSDPLCCAVGYYATQEMQTIAAHISDLSSEQLPDLLLVLDPALLCVSSTLASDLGWTVPAGQDHFIGVAPVQQRKDGAVLAGAYVPPPDKVSRQAIHEGSLHTIFSLPDREAYLAESARALLLFAEGLLTGLALRDSRPVPSFHHYVTQELRDLIPIRASTDGRGQDG
ncbi:DUF6602 domain-containing protein [Myceligenerans salitolerans]|uniref:DUF6602 domain-containing protein n=1 Tax=Myceligenerans salitolerans TaxID=1230528 RepID=A0ABS3I8S2_9MICO|nr:DUF6602 domain-containing protein [Myceligenerans salitolerans]MBO0609368.1 hypothetical protein [Myceligenerans salitolerans]